MLMGIITALAVLTAVIVAFMAEKLWLIAAVAGFVAGWIGWLILALVFLVVCSLVVDQEKEQAHDSKFYRFIAHLYIDFAVTVGRMRIHTAGLEKTPKEGRFLLVCNHLSDIDPAVILKCFPKSQLTFISKQENKVKPIVGPVMHKLLCPLLNRENDREALKTILKCIDFIKNDEVSVGVFPEGYVSMDGKLRHFRGGVFKIAQRTGVPIVVCTLRNTRQAMHKLLRLEPSEVTLHLVDVIPGEEAKATPTVEMAERIYEMMIADLGEDRRCNEKGMHPDLQQKPED